MSAGLSKLEAAELGRHEAVIERGMATFVEVGNALIAIREGRLYRRIFDNFEDYCRERWGMVASRARQLIGAAQAVRNLESVTEVTPVTERQARPLARLEPEQQREAWREAVESAPDGRPTAKQVEAAAERIAPRPSKPAPMPVHAELWPAEFICPECHDRFSEVVWHCPGCDHHWMRGKDLCTNCHAYECDEAGVVGPVASPGDEDEDAGDEPAPLTVAATDAGTEAWNKLFSDFLHLATSIDRRGGIRTLAARWHADRVRRAIDSAEEISKSFDRYAADFRSLLS